MSTQGCYGPFVNKFATGVAPTTGVLSGVIGRDPVQKLALTVVAAAREQVIDDHLKCRPTGWVQGFAVTRKIGHTADANAIGKAGDGDLVSFVEDCRLRSAALVDDQDRNRVSPGRLLEALSVAGLAAQYAYDSDPAVPITVGIFLWSLMGQRASGRAMPPSG